MPKNLLGRSLDQSTAISNNRTVRNQVGEKKQTDLFRFSLGGLHQISLKFRSQAHAAQISLIQDQNQNGQVDQGEVLKRTQMQPQKNGTINVANAKTGTYFVHVTKLERGTSRYQFTLNTTPVTTLNSSTSSNSSIINEIVSLTNSYRQQNGLAPVTLNSQLSNAAQTHTQNMALQDFVNHTGTDGGTVAQRVSNTGYGWSLVAENIAAGYRTAADVVQGWIDSPGHRENLLNASVTEIGVGYYFLENDTGNTNYNYYWTQVLADPSA